MYGVTHQLLCSLSFVSFFQYEYNMPWCFFFVCFIYYFCLLFSQLFVSYLLTVFIFEKVSAILSLQIFHLLHSMFSFWYSKYTYAIQFQILPHFLSILFFFFFCCIYFCFVVSNWPLFKTTTSSSDCVSYTEETIQNTQKKFLEFFF